MFPSQTYLIYRILRGRTEFADVALNVAAANPFLWSPILLSNIIYKVKADIQRHCRDIISNQHGQHVCPLKCYSQHKWIKKTEAHSFDRPYFPSTVFQGQGCQAEIIQTNRLLPSQASSMFINSNSERKRTNELGAVSFYRPYFPPTKTSISYVI